MNKIQRIIINLTYIQAICLGFINLMGLNFYPHSATYISYSKYILAFLLPFILCEGKGMSHNQKKVLWIFCFYTMFIVWYYVFPKMATSLMLAVPLSLSSLILQSAYIGILLFYADRAKQFLSFKALLYTYVFGAIIPCLIYVNLIGFDTMQRLGYDSNIVVIAALTTGYTASGVLMASILLKNDFSTKKWLNLLISVLVSIACVYVLLASGKRGPIIWTFLGWIVYVFFTTDRSYKFFIRISTIIILLLVFGDLLLDYLRNYSEFTISRIEDTIYGHDTSNRMDDADSGYYVAIRQFFSHPILGSYFRLISPGSTWHGMYPHNLFLEVAITSGIFGLIPFTRLIINTFKNIKHYNILEDRTHSFFFLVFVTSLCSLMTTGTILLNVSFWVSLVFVNLINTESHDKI